MDPEGPARSEQPGPRARSVESTALRAGGSEPRTEGPPATAAAGVADQIQDCFRRVPRHEVRVEQIRGRGDASSGVRAEDQIKYPAHSALRTAPALGVRQAERRHRAADAAQLTGAGQATGGSTSSSADPFSAWPTWIN